MISSSYTLEFITISLLQPTTQIIAYFRTFSVEVNVSHQSNCNKARCCSKSESQSERISSYRLRTLRALFVFTTRGFYGIEKNEQLFSGCNQAEHKIETKQNKFAPGSRQCSFTCQACKQFHAKYPPFVSQSQCKFFLTHAILLYNSIIIGTSCGVNRNHKFDAAKRFFFFKKSNFRMFFETLKMKIFVFKRFKVELYIHAIFLQFLVAKLNSYSWARDEFIVIYRFAAASSQKLQFSGKFQSTFRRDFGIRDVWLSNALFYPLALWNCSKCRPI